MTHAVIPAELARRPSRPPDCAAENRALTRLAEEMAGHPEGVLQKLAEIARELCHADAAALGAIEPDGEKGLLHWYAATEVLPCGACPDGMVMARNEVLLFDGPEEVFPALGQREPRIYENLLAPFVANGAPGGALWAIKHTRAGRFDAEDARVLGVLARFASAAWQMVTAVQSARGGQQAERRAAELRAVLDGMSDAVYIGGMEGITLANQAALDQLGYETAEELNRHIGTLAEELDTRDAETGESIPVERQAFARALAGEHVVQVVRVRHRSRGEERLVRCAASPVVLEGKVIAAVAVNTDVTGQARTEQALRESKAQLAADLQGMRRLYDLHARLAAEDDLHAALNEILAAAVEFVGTNRGTVQLVSEDGERLEIVADRGYGAGDRFVEYFRNAGSKPACDAARLQRKRLIIEDIANFPPLAGTSDREIALADGIRATTCTPMISRKGNMVGVLCTQFPQPHRPDDHELRLIDLLAWTAAEYVERHRAEQAQRASEERLRGVLETLASDLLDMTRLYNLNERLMHSETLETSLEEILAVAIEFTRTDRGNIQLLTEDGNLRLAVHRGHGAEFVEHFRISGCAAACEAALASKQRVVLEDLAAEPVLAETKDFEVMLGEGIRAVQSTPLITRQGRVVGMLSTHFTQPHRPAEAELRKLDLLAAMASEFIDHAQADAALRESEQRLRLFVENVREYALFQTDPEGKISSWNPGAQRLFGYTTAEMLGESADRLFTREDQAKRLLDNEIARVLAGEREENARWVVRKDGSKFWAQWVTEPIRDDLGQIGGVAKVLRDETERRRADEITRRSLAEKEALLKEVHHRVKNNLQVIVSLLNMQARQIEDERVVSLFEETRNRVQSIASIHELLYGGESFAGIELSPYARQLAPDLVRFYGLEGRVKVEVLGDGAMLELERAVPYGILLNELVSNACKHAFREGRRGQITITIRPNGDRVEMSVADDGKGLPPGFDYRRGSSLGLKLVDGLVRQLRGRIEIRSQAGTIATVRFPGAGIKADR